MEMAPPTSMLRSAAWLALALCGPVVAPAQSLSPGFTYTLRVTSRTPAAQPGISDGAGVLSYVGHVQWSGGHGRVDIVDGGLDPLFTKGDYLLVDSATVLVVHPAKQEYFPLGADDSTNAGLAALTGTMRLSDEKVALDSVGIGDTISGVPTKRYRLTVGFNMSMDGGLGQQRLGTESVTDYWVGVVPGLPGNPLLRSNGLSSAVPSMFKSLSARVDSAAARMAGALPLRTSATTRVVLGPGQVIQTQQSSQISELKRAGIDQSLLMIPAGFKKVAMP